ncbi:MAG: Fe-S cluster assembly protein SufD [Candidatus Eisenbacteria bacterium]
MTNAQDTMHPFALRFEELEKGWGATGPEWVLRLRRAAMAAFQEGGIPTPKHEEWKYTDVRELDRITLTHADGTPSTGADIGPVPDLTTGADETVVRIVLVDGLFVPALSDLTSAPSGLRVQPLSVVLREQRAELESHLGSVAPVESHPFVALNTAFFQDGVHVFVPAGCKERVTVHVVHLASGGGAAGTTVNAAHPRNLYVLGESAVVRVVEEYAASGAGPHTDSPYLTNPVTEAIIGANARLELYKVVRESGQVFHVAGTFARIDRDGHLDAHNVSQGGRLIRNDLRVELNGPGGGCVLNGLNVATGRQLMDDHTEIVHAVPHCASREYYRSVLSDESQGVFNGKVFVRPDAQKTDGIQSNNALVLSPKALMNTKPQLEIYADDVKCTHGATIGQLDPDSLFYLRSRGIEAETARRMLVHAFASDVVDRMAWEPMRVLAGSMLDETLGR